jgi:hypothetical protein
MNYDLLFAFAGSVVGIIVGWGIWHRARHALNSSREVDVQTMREIQHRIRMAKTEAQVYQQRHPNDGKH